MSSMLQSLSVSRRQRRDVRAICFPQSMIGQSGEALVEVLCQAAFGGKGFQVRQEAGGFGIAGRIAPVLANPLTRSLDANLDQQGFIV